MKSKKYKYDVALSFAGEDRKYAREIAEALSSKGVKVFYDEYESAELWGKNLYDHLDDVYQNKAKYVIMILSKHYKSKLWTTHERRSAQARAFRENTEFILPIKLDNTEIPGIPSTIGYVDLRKSSVEEIGKLIVKKLQDGTIQLIDLKGDEQEVLIPKVKRTVTEEEKQQFLKKSFKEIQNYFESAIDKLAKNNPHIEIIFSPDDNRFTVSIRVENNLKAACKIWINKEHFIGTSILFKETTTGFDSGDFSYNDSATVEEDGHEIYFRILGMTFGKVPGAENINLQRASAKDVAKFFWGRLIRYLEY